MADEGSSARVKMHGPYHNQLLPQETGLPLRKVMASGTVLCAFPLVAFKIFTLSYDLSGFSGICLKRDYFAFILCRVN